jgi:DNA (cytosine-5)-methyltransferase 1
VSQRQLRILSFAKTALLPGEIGVDLFAGGGGFSEGWSWAVGVPPALAVNHDRAAIEMHRANHPETEHHLSDVFEVDPVEATRGRSVGWLHASPDCRHFSRAKGSTPKTARPLSKKIRGLAWVVVKWAAAVRPRIISLENVAEFVTWGPLHQQGPRAHTPNKKLRGTTFRKFIAALETLGYAVEWRELKACDFGAPTSRKRLFVVARRDGLPIVWPKPTHGPKASKPYRTAAECIDWSIPIPSIFDRKKPLAEATLRRIAEGIRRYVIESTHPFIVNLTHGGRLEPIDQPMATVTGAHRGEKAVVAPTLIQTSYGERKGQSPRVLDLHEPLGTVVAGGQKHALVAAFMAQHNTGLVGHAMESPVSTIVGKGCTQALVAAQLTKFYGTNKSGAPIDEPAPTITAAADGGHLGLVAAHLAKYYGSDENGQRIDDSMHTVTTKDRFGLVAAFLARYHGEKKSGEKARVESLDGPLPTQTTENRFGIVTVTIDGQEYAIADIGMRMLQPRELATAQGFPTTYVLTGTKTQQVAKIGNSVPPQFAEAIVRANLSNDGEEAEVAA